MKKHPLYEQYHRESESFTLKFQSSFSRIRSFLRMLKEASTQIITKQGYEHI